MRIEGEDAMLALGARIAAALDAGLVIYLQGDLGAGKTTLTRGILRGLGYGGAVRSPTYTLLEPYQLDEMTLFHLDLYRLADPEELEYLGLRDLMSEDDVVMVEWPEMGRGVLANADLEICIDHRGDAREVLLKSNTSRGDSLRVRLERSS